MESLEKLTFLEGYAMFMGKAQIIEFGMKRLLIDERGYKYEDTETKTLGWVIGELEKNGLRKDFFIILNELLEYRNYFAHDFLADQALMNFLLKGEGSFTKPVRELSKAEYSAEQVLLVYDFLREGTFWGG